MTHSTSAHGRSGERSRGGCVDVAGADVAGADNVEVDTVVVVRDVGVDCEDGVRVVPDVGFALLTERVAVEVLEAVLDALSVGLRGGANPFHSITPTRNIFNICDRTA